MAHDLLPPGEAKRRAVRWISEQRSYGPNRSDLELIDEASRLFDLSPIEEEFLLQLLRENPRPKVS